jgi:polyhydroxybutyrate depolymerase
MNRHAWTVFLLMIFGGMHTTGVYAQPQVGFSEHSMTSAGAQRSYLLYVPQSYSGQPAALVFSFHGSGSYPQNQVDTSGFDRLAEEHGFIAVFPAGEFTNSVSARSWNANVEAGVDDVQFTRDMIDEISGQLAIDASRIYASGFSGGGRISSRLACALSDVLAAAAPVAGLQYPDDCTLKRPIPIITFHAEDDPVNNYEVQANSRPYWRMGVETALDRWRQANGCTLANTHEQVAYNIRVYAWTECGGGGEILFYQTITGGHTWPGAPQRGAVQDISASELIWEFFSRHSL